MYDATVSAMNSTGNKFRSATNVITYGYRKNGSLIESFHPNSLHNYFMSSTWAWILQTFGEALVSFLLQNCSIFFKNYSSDSLLQICGPPLSEMPFNSVPSFTDKSSKRVLNRLSMLYGKSILACHSQVCGLPSKRKIPFCEWDYFIIF